MCISATQALILLLSMILLAGCTTVAKNPWDEPGAGPSPSELAVDACNPIGHLKCIYLTGRETLADGAEGKFTFHWWRMSYIGRACEEQYGRTAGVIAEALFAIPHYTAMAIGNAAATLAYPFRRRDEQDENSTDNNALTDFVVPGPGNNSQEISHYEPLPFDTQQPAGPVSVYQPGQR